jgi:hypothetical protein
VAEAAKNSRGIQTLAPNPPVPVLDMARPDLRHEEREAAVRKIWKWVGYSVLTVVLLVIVLVALMVRRINYVMSARPNQWQKDAAAMQLPQNYKAAALYLARLAQSDPVLWQSEAGEVFPDWLPPELGMFHQDDLVVSSAGCYMNWGGGGDDYTTLGAPPVYHLDADPAASNPSESAFVLSYGISSQFHIKIARTDHIGEEEFVRRALVELKRRRAG